MLHEQKKVFILKNKKYFEISYAEYCEKAQTEFKDKFFIFLHGALMEVSEEFYKEFYRNKRREQYIKIRSLKRELYYQSLDSDYFSGEEILPNLDDDVSDKVINKIFANEIRDLIESLPIDERDLIIEHFYKEIPQTELAKKYGINQSNISRKITRILLKLKKILENL